jgi:transposase-like protein
MRKKVEEKRAGRRRRRSFTASFKAEVVALVRQGDRTIPTICREMELSETAVRAGGSRRRPWTRATRTG